MSFPLSINKTTVPNTVSIFAREVHGVYEYGSL